MTVRGGLPIGLLATLALGGALFAERQTPLAPRTPAALWDRGLEAWEAGRYPDALADLTTLLTGPEAADYRDRVALLTGEIFPSIELATDGRNPRISAGGRYLAYDTGTGAGAVTRVVRVEAGAPLVVEVRGTDAVFDPAGTRIAWLTAPAGAPPQARAVVVRDLTSGAEREWLGPGLVNSGLAWSGDGARVIFLGLDPADPSRSDVFAADGVSPAVRLSTQPGLKSRPLMDPRGGVLVYALSESGARGRPGGAGQAGTTAIVEDLGTGALRRLTGIAGTTLTLSADGTTMAWIARDPGGPLVLRRASTRGGPVVDVRTAATGQRLDAPALSPDGALLAYQFMAGVGSQTDWDIYVADAAGAHRRITSGIQHDVLPRFLDATTLLTLMGEPRHRRSHVHDVRTGESRRVFANNTIRTISPEYVWAASPDGRFLAIEADRDGDTVSPAHSVTVLDLTRTVTLAELRARLNAQRAAEMDLRDRMTKAFQPVAAFAREIVATISPTRVYRHEQALTAFGSKHISQPGNARAIDYLDQAYRAYGYTPERQWLPAGPGGSARTANVVATLTGTRDPDVVYVVSSHFDSVAGGPGADDNTSGTAALLEAARALAKTPLPATVIFASFTGEEAGLLGSREFVRLAAERQWRIAGALNNDMIGWAGESGRMDNTIRYSNAGIRDIQHGAAFLFSSLVLYDAKYYRGTDAAAFYEGWGDIVGGLGSYPVLGNPNYHQPTDLLETINFTQVAETAKVTAATIVYLASSPSRLTDVSATRTAQGIEVRWSAARESDVASYLVAYGPSLERRRTVRSPQATLPALPSGTTIAVKALNRRGLEGWDWATTRVP